MWRFDEHGQRRLSHRRVSVLVRHLPVDSALALATGSPGWRLEHYLAAHVYQATAGAPHPGLPKHSAVADPERDKRIQQAQARVRERQRAIDAGEIT